MRVDYEDETNWMEPWATNSYWSKPADISQFEQRLRTVAIVVVFAPCINENLSWKVFSQQLLYLDSGSRHGLAPIDKAVSTPPSMAMALNGWITPSESRTPNTLNSPSYDSSGPAKLMRRLSSDSNSSNVPDKAQ